MAYRLRLATETCATKIVGARRQNHTRSSNRMKVLRSLRNVGSRHTAPISIWILRFSPGNFGSRHTVHSSSASTQILRTRAESQQIVAQGHSHAYNTQFYFKSYTKDLSLPIFEIVLKHNDHEFCPAVGLYNSMFLDPQA